MRNSALLKNVVTTRQQNIKHLSASLVSQTSSTTRSAHHNFSSVNNLDHHNKHTTFQVATVFGCTGFLGRYIVSQLAAAGYQVITPWRDDQFAIMPLRVMGDVGQIIEMRYSAEKYDTLLNICARSNIVINCIGRDYNKLFDTKMIDSNVNVPPLIARAARETNVEQFFHFSALNADEKHPSKYLRQKAIGELRVRNEFPDATILRPANVYGTEDRFMNWIAKCIRILPGVPLAGGGAAKVQPIFCVDVANALVAALGKDVAGKVIEMAGPEIFTWATLADTIGERIGEDVRIMRTNALTSFFMGLVNEYTWQPGYTRDLAVRQAYDNIAHVNDPSVLQLQDLGYVPSLFEDAAKEPLARWNRNRDYFLNLNSKE